MIIVIVLLIIISVVYLFLHQPQFGKIPSGKYAERVNRSPQYRNGRFNNLSPTPDLTEGATFFKVLKEFLFEKSKRNRPSGPLPSIKTDLLHLHPTEDIMVWMGHSSYFIHLDGKTILVDPVLSGNASPVSFTTKSFPGSDIYATEDLPEIDFLFISHDHWDHLDYKTIKLLKPKIKKVITGPGVGAHLHSWGFNKNMIEEIDWNESVTLSIGFEVTATPARHFSGRAFRRNQSLWCSFVLKSPSMKIYIGGDSGFDNHFATIGAAHGPFDLAILECGQYNKSWKYIHMMPEEVVRASQDLMAKKLMIVHWAKFSLALHDWDEPITRVLEESRRKNVDLIHPMIGEAVLLKNMTPGNEWWKLIA